MLIHRGPDSHGTFLKGDIALAMRRLSIIDLPGGSQPMVSNDKRFVIIFNGEIYNHEELGIALKAKGYPIKTRSDTEVLLYSFIDQGPQCLTKLNGMFAFSIWDNQKKELFIARDRLGIKPLYYTLNSKRFMFASELTPFYHSKLFPINLNHQAISDYLAYWYICEPQTILKDVFQLPPGTYAIIREGNMKQVSYWQPPTEPETPIPFEQASEELLELLKDSVKIRMKVDVPIGTFLSGGIDSGLITSLAAPHLKERLQAFIIGFKEKTYSELDEANQTARKHSVKVCSTMVDTITADSLDDIFRAFDEPLGNASFVPTYFLSKAASQKLKVVLTGDGADELFGGYPTYQAPYYQKAYQWLPGALRTLAENLIPKIPVSHNRISLDYRLKQLIRGISLPYQRAHYTWREVTPKYLQNDMFREHILKDIKEYDPFSVANAYFSKASRLSTPNQLMYVDMNTFLLNDHLRKVDRMSMAHSLEARLPYLDYRIVEFASKLPSEHKVTFFQTKKILKHIAKAYLPESVISGKKKGLTSPIAGWISLQLKDYVNDNLKGGMMDDLFSTKMVQSLLQEHYNNDKDNSRIIWGLLTLQMWGKKLNARTESMEHATH
jgi:asparagine synthase (glutamine-hydrolysing)